MEKENEKFTENLENQVNEDIDLEIPEVNLPDYVLEVKDLYKSYGKKQVLKGLNLQVKKGEVFTKENIWVKRPGTGEILAKDFKKILGKKAVEDIAADTQLKNDMVE